MQVYPGAIPLDTNVLQPQRNVEIALGFMMQAAFGTGTVIDGLAVTQTGTPGMGVLVGPGSIITNTTVDTLASGFGSLTYDGTDPLVKIGVNLTSTTMSVLTAPGVAGQSQNWLVEAQFIEADGSPVVLPYYNAANPAIPYTGPANAGTPNNTARTNRVQFQWKGGTAATTGTQNTPTPDSGWVGVAIITIANGQASILNANITPYSAAPFVPTKLPQQRTKLQANLNIYVATTGSDTANSGLSLASPFLTIQKAWNTIINNYDLNSFAVTINLANGTYSTGLLAQGTAVGNTQGPGGIILLGNVGSPSSVTISVSGSNCISAPNGGQITLAGGYTLISAAGVQGVSGNAILAPIQSSVLINGPVVFGACGQAHIMTLTGGSVVIIGNYTINGNSPYHHLNQGGTQNIGLITVTLTGTPAFTAFATAFFTSFTQSLGVTYSGAATGSRYQASMNGVINTQGGGANYFPGNVAGTTALGGQYA